MLRFFRPEPNKRFSKFDILVYALFERRWKQHFIAYPDLRKAFIDQLQQFDEKRKHPIGKLSVVPSPTTADVPKRDND